MLTINEGDVYGDNNYDGGGRVEGRERSNGPESESWSLRERFLERS